MALHSSTDIFHFAEFDLIFYDEVGRFYAFHLMLVSISLHVYFLHMIHLLTKGRQTVTIVLNPVIPQKLSVPRFASML